MAAAAFDYLCLRPVGHRQDTLLSECAPIAEAADKY